MLKILVVGPAWVGDMVMAQSLFITLKQQNPNSVIDVLAPKWSLAILSRMPEVNKAISLDVTHGTLNLKLRYQSGKKLRNNYGQAIVIPRSFKASLVPFFAKIPVRTGFRGEFRYGLLNDIRTLDKKTLTQTIQKTVTLGLPKNSNLQPKISFPKLSIDTKNQAQILKQYNISVGKSIALMPGAEYGKAKQWPLKYFIKVAQIASENGFKILVLGSDKDKASGDEIANNSNAINLCGKTSLADVIDLLAVCEKSITNDSGLMHIAAAVGCEVIAIYGSSSPNYTPPLTNNKKVFYLNLDCSPCFARICKLKTYDCLTQITPQQVLSNVKSSH